MRLLNTLTMSVFVKPEEDENTLTEIMKTLFPFSLEEEKILIKRTITKSFDERKIIILEIRLDKERHLKKFIENLNKELTPDDKKLILSQENRLDENLLFYLRFDKEALQNGVIKLTDKGNCYHVKMNIAAFPKKREIALKILKEIFK